MLVRTCCALLLLLFAVPAGAQPGLSGKWGDDGQTYLDLQHDGIGGVTGTVTWRADGKESTLPIKSGRFDQKTGAFTLEGEGQGPDGRTAAYTIEGTLTGDVVRGKYRMGDHSGDFSFDRQNGAAQQFDYLLGDWEFTGVDKKYGKVRGYWSAVKLAEGQILDEFRIVGDNGETYYVTATLRNYNKYQARWELVGSEPGTGLQDVGTGRKVLDEMVITQTFGMASGQPWVMRIRYYNIKPESFSWAADRSDDGGKTWVKEHLTLEAKRIGAPRTLPALAPARNKTPQ